MATKCKHCPDGAPWFATVEKRDAHIEEAHPELDADAALAAALGRREIEGFVTIEGDEIDLLDAVMFIYEIDNMNEIFAEAINLWFETARQIPRVAEACALRIAHREAVEREAESTQPTSLVDRLLGDRPDEEEAD